MINFNELDFRRMAIHQIIAKSEDDNHATAILDTKLLSINPEVVKIIKDRLAKASSNGSKSFEMFIEAKDGGSFFSHIQKLNMADDDVFIRTTGEVAWLLAKAQTKNTIPGGYIIFIEAITAMGNSAYITIKAEVNEALRFEMEDGRPRLDLLDDVFLTPQQRLFKFGMIHERSDTDDQTPEDDQLWPNNKFGAILFDNQFSVDSKPAEYFYKDFLGFSADRNPKIQSKRFYDATENFIKNNVMNYEDKDDMISALKQEFMSDDVADVNPMDFAQSYFTDEDLSEQYASEVAHYLPEYIIKDPGLIKSNLNKKKIAFPNKVEISGPSKTFDHSVEIIHSIAQISDYDDNDDNYTIIKVKGKPFQQ